MLFAVHNLYPSLRTYTTPFLHLPHYQPAKGTYVQGMDDICYLVTGVLMFTAVRAATIEWLFEPIAHWCGLKGKPALRFAEQGWLVVYYFTFWSYGTVRTPRRRCLFEYY
jgi:acyl-CoA-dependent ceramide synthase